MRTLSEKDMSTPQRKLAQTLEGTKDFTQASVSRKVKAHTVPPVRQFPQKSLHVETGGAGFALFCLRQGLSV